jgi:hypothetical protein
MIHKIEVPHRGHNYVFRFTDATRKATMQLIGQQASDLIHPLTWYQAAQLSHQMRKTPKVATNRFQLPQVKP